MKTLKTTIYNLSMFFIAPFIGLLYIFLLPVVSVALLAWFTVVHFLPETAKATLKAVLGEGSINPSVLIAVRS